MSDHAHGDNSATPLVGKTFEGRDQAISGIVKMWSGRLAESQRSRREIEVQLERTAEYAEELKRRYELVIGLLTEEQRAQFLDMLTRGNQQD